MDYRQTKSHFRSVSLRNNLQQKETPNQKLHNVLIKKKKKKF